MFKIVKYIKLIFVAVGVSFPIVTTLSQESTINQDVRVVREYNPTVSDAFKINEMPERTEVDTKAPVFTYQLSGRALVGAPEVVPLIAAKMAKEPQEELYTSYAKAYLGNYELFGGGLYYNIVQNKDFAVALKAAHESSWGRLNVDKNKVKAPYHDTEAGFFLKHFFSRKTLSLDMDFNNHAYRYYGLHTMEPGINYFAPYPNPVSSLFPIVAGENLIPEPEMSFSTFDVNVGLLNQVSSKDFTHYDLNMGFSSFANKIGVKENQFHFSGNFDFPVGEIGVRLETLIDHAAMSNSTTNKMPDMFQFQNRQQSLIQANPALVRHSKNASLKMGLRFGAEFDDIEDNFYLAPDVTIDLKVADGIIGVNGGVTGVLNQGTYRNVMEENPFVMPDLNVITSNTIKFFLGVKGNFSRETSFSARMDYNVFYNEHFFVNKSYTPFPASLQSPNDYSNLFDVDYDDGTMLSVSGEFKMKFIPELDITLRGALNSWALDSLTHAWHKPEMEIGLRANYQFDDRLSFYSAINVLGTRYAYIPEEGVQALKPVYDFNLGANYIYTRRWNFFGEVRNMIASKYNRWQGYPQQGFNARVGVGYCF